jgi:DNA-binding NtrC family response regulator
MFDSTRQPSILIADDQADVLEALRLLLKAEGCRSESANSPRAVINAVEAREFDAVVIDLNYARDTTSGREGLDLMEHLRAIDETLPVIVMTAWGSVELAVEAMRRGAGDFVQKPWENERLATIVRTQVELGRARREGRQLAEENEALRARRFPQVIAQSRSMRQVLSVIARVAASDTNVLITGENGTGKNLAASLIHASSARAQRPLITVNCGGLAEGLFESELFGHVKGAFTDARTDRMGRFELADRGTLFLDEIGNLPAALQAKLLRALESGEFERVGSSRTRHVNARILSATNCPIHEAIAAGRFREDLFFRLNTIEIHLPPLRERREDIPLLAAHFSKQHATRYAKPVEAIDARAMDALIAHAWPGNVRELDHTIERAVLLAEGSEIRVADLGLRPVQGSGRLDEMSLEEVESLLIRKALARFHGNVSASAEALGLSRSALYRRLQRYGISTGQFESAH